MKGASRRRGDHGERRQGQRSYSSHAKGPGYEHVNPR
jgi:hypothetical protein